MSNRVLKFVRVHTSASAAVWMAAPWSGHQRAATRNLVCQMRNKIAGNKVKPRLAEGSREGAETGVRPHEPHVPHPGRAWTLIGSGLAWQTTRFPFAGGRSSGPRTPQNNTTTSAPACLTDGERDNMTLGRRRPRSRKKYNHRWCCDPRGRGEQGGQGKDG